jgi:5'-nucleotidase (lipoprotein e(P4) family)
MRKLASTILFGIVLNGYAVSNIEICAHTYSKNDITQSVKWYRKSSEKKALYKQTYNMGTLYVNNWVKSHHPKPKTWGVILDIDETVLDNSWYLYECGDTINNESDFSHFIANAKKSVAIPGSIAFVNLVHNLGGYVSLVTNRDGSFKDGRGKISDITLANLREQKIYFDQVIFANVRDSKNPRDKNPRFEAVITSQYNSTEMVWSNPLPAHKVIAYFGDNIQDFPNLHQSAVSAVDGNDTMFQQFGNGYFILPNPMYGSWQSN